MSTLCIAYNKFQFLFKLSKHIHTLHSCIAFSSLSYHRLPVCFILAHNAGLPLSTEELKKQGFWDLFRWDKWSRLLPFGGYALVQCFCCDFWLHLLSLIFCQFLILESGQGNDSATKLMGDGFPQALCLFYDCSVVGWIMALALSREAWNVDVIHFLLQLYHHQILNYI